ncbi:PREDICTED: isoflavone reductase homolog P3-like [Camelina sativa]|uniref:Isoflavone reductase homolog P3-like n=1 Tax=Camelina sativa TaxID=90675 RepID=A0ABM0SUP4_CAMSA|nr:PREDICTED: isoflavone reductase homolog P3-like [Camelina sativa]
MTTEKSKILVIGGTGYMGEFVVEASAKAGNPTFALVREASLSDHVKGKTVQRFKDLGVTILHGDLNDHESLVKAIKQVDVVISAVGSKQILDQTKIISAIKEAARFLPAEFGVDVERTSAVESAKTFFARKVQIRKAIEAERIPYTYIVSNCSAGFYLRTLVQFESSLISHTRDKVIIFGEDSVPPRDKVTILGDGIAKVVINKEEDTAAYRIRTVDDPRTLNKTLYIKPPKNTLSMNDMVTLWEKKIGKSLEKIHISEEQILKSIQVPIDVFKAINHSIFVKGDQTSFTIEPSYGVEASELYPDIKYITVDEYLSELV